MPAKLGSGKRFQHLTDQGVSPALAAWIGRRKWGKKRFQHLAAAAQKAFTSLATVEKYNPNHAPAGSPAGGQFASGTGSYQGSIARTLGHMPRFRRDGVEVTVASGHDAGRSAVTLNRTHDMMIGRGAGEHAVRFTDRSGGHGVFSVHQLNLAHR